MPDKLTVSDARKALRTRKELVDSGGAPDLFTKASVPATNAEHQGISLLETTPSPLPLDAYLACALTGLSTSERDVIFGISDLVSQICNEHNITLYEPRKRTDPVLHTNV